MVAQPPTRDELATLRAELATRPGLLERFVDGLAELAVSPAAIESRERAAREASTPAKGTVV